MNSKEWADYYEPLLNLGPCKTYELIDDLAISEALLHDAMELLTNVVKGKAESDPEIWKEYGKLLSRHQRFQKGIASI
jgi:hypothetical protein